MIQIIIHYFSLTRLKNNKKAPENLLLIQPKSYNQKSFTFVFGYSYPQGIKDVRFKQNKCTSYYFIFILNAILIIRCTHFELSLCFIPIYQ